MSLWEWLGPVSGSILAPHVCSISLRLVEGSISLARPSLAFQILRALTLFLLLNSGILTRLVAFFLLLFNKYLNSLRKHNANFFHLRCMQAHTKERDLFPSKVSCNPVKCSIVSSHPSPVSRGEKTSCWAVKDPKLVSHLVNILGKPAKRLVNYWASRVVSLALNFSDDFHMWSARGTIKNLSPKVSSISSRTFWLLFLLPRRL